MLNRITAEIALRRHDEGQHWDGAVRTVSTALAAHEAAGLRAVADGRVVFSYRVPRPRPGDEAASRELQSVIDHPRVEGIGVRLFVRLAAHDLITGERPLGAGAQDPFTAKLTDFGEQVLEASGR